MWAEKISIYRKKVLSLVFKEIIQIENTKIQKYENQISTTIRQHGEKKKTTTTFIGAIKDM